MRFEGSWRVAVLASAVVLSGCAGLNPGATVDEVRARAASGSACVAATTRALGIEVATVHDFRPDARQRAAKLLAIDEALQVVAIEPGSPADLAGLRVGDRIEAVDGAAVPPGARARDGFLAAVEAGVPQRVLRVRRDGEVHAVPVAARSACSTSI